MLIGRNIAPWSVTERAPVLWHHPFANHTLEAKLVYPSQRFDKERSLLLEVEGTESMHEFLDLPSGWPGPDDPFPD